jgi:ArsR family transcriptional regulator, virulence genes transcriptional regulator
MMIDGGDIFRIHADFCACLANEKRLRILWILAEGEASVGEIAEKLNIPISNISQHLRILRDKGAVIVRKNKQKMYYSIAHKSFIDGCKLIRQGLVESINSRAKIVSGE